MLNLRDTIVPRSDQLNAEQLLSAPITLTVNNVTRGTADQPVSIHYDGDNGRPYKPCKTMRKLLIFAWGDDGRVWLGRSMTVYNDPDVKFGGVKVGGIRISHLSHIDADFEVALTSTKGKKALHSIKKMDNAVDPIAPHRASLQTAAANGIEAFKAAWLAIPKQYQPALTELKDSLKSTITTTEEIPNGV
jgi:hypothetical protein